MGEWLLNRRWVLLTLWGFSVLVIEIIEDKPYLGTITADFYLESFIYGLVYPVLFGKILNLLVAARTEQIRSRYYQNLRSNLRLQLNAAGDRNELAGVLLQFLRVVTPIVGATILVNNHATRGFETISDWNLDEDSNLLRPKLSPERLECVFSQSVQRNGDGFFTPCGCLRETSAEKTFSCYCISFQHSGAPLVGAHLYYPHGTAPDSDQLQLLREVVPGIETAFERAQLQQTVKRQHDNLNAEQQRIARDVHDTLGHSLAFLNLKLDQVTMEINQSEVVSLRREVETIRDIAEEAYDQMRDVLVALTLESGSNLTDTLLSHADRIQQRANFNLQVRSSGEPRTLPSIVQRHIFLIFQEALTNIEKHAQARRVDVGLNWGESELEIAITDDGSGFEPSLAVTDGHFGLQNMRERALEIRARLTIGSDSGRGARIELQVPYDALT